MSTIKVDSIQATDETASRAVSGVAAAWCSFDTTGTVATIGSFNVSSLSDVATGQTALNLSSAFAAVDYASSADNKAQSTAATYRGGLNYEGCTTSLLNYRCGTSSGYVDSNYNAITVHGDLA